VSDAHLHHLCHHEIDCERERGERAEDKKKRKKDETSPGGEVTPSEKETLTGELTVARTENTCRGVATQRWRRRLLIEKATDVKQDRELPRSLFCFRKAAREKRGKIIN
jgi:hypothetical protein